MADLLVSADNLPGSWTSSDAVGPYAVRQPVSPWVPVEHLPLVHIEAQPTKHPTMVIAEHDRSLAVGDRVRLMLECPCGVVFHRDHDPLYPAGWTARVAEILTRDHDYLVRLDEWEQESEDPT